LVGLVEINTIQTNSGYLSKGLKTTYFSLIALAFLSLTTPIGLERSRNTAGLLRSNSSEV
jgi:hypothetical protein